MQRNAVKVIKQYSKITMPILLVTFLLTTFVLSYGQNVSFTISGKFIHQTSSKKIYLNGPDLYDSITLQNDKTFHYQGRLGKPGQVLMYTENSYPWAVWFNGGIIHVELEEYKDTSQTQANKMYLKVRSLKGSYETEVHQNLVEALHVLVDKYPRRDVLGADSAMHAFFPLVKNFAQKNKTSYLSAFLANDYPFALEDKKDLLFIIQNNPSKDDIERLKAFIEQGELLQKGKAFANFTQPTPTGQSIELYALKSRFILIQFWSSWCAPCRAENPELIALYTQYHPMGLEIIGISLDDSISDWTQAIVKDQLPWIHVSDLLGWENSVARKYKIDHVPFNILIDSSYSVIASDLWPVQIRKILNQYLAK